MLKASISIDTEEYGICMRILNIIKTMEPKWKIDSFLLNTMNILNISFGYFSHHQTFHKCIKILFYAYSSRDSVKILLTPAFPSIWLLSSASTTSQISWRTRLKFTVSRAEFSTTRCMSKYSSNGAIASQVGKLSGDQARWNIAFFNGGLIYISRYFSIITLFIWYYNIKCSATAWYT